MLSYSLAVHRVCFCSFWVKYVCYVPIYSPLNVMEPRNILEITPPILLALSTVSSRVHNLTVGSLCTRMHYPAPQSAASISPFAVGMWDGGVLDAVSEVCCALGYTSPVSCKEWLLKVQQQGHSAFEIHLLLLSLCFSLQMSESAPLICLHSFHLNATREKQRGRFMSLRSRI